MEVTWRIGAIAFGVHLFFAGHMLNAVLEKQSVQEVSPDFVLDDWEDSPAGPSYLYEPTSVAISSSGNIFVLDAGNQRVVVFDSNGDFHHSFGRAGQGPGEFNFGTDAEDDIAVDGDFVVILEKQRRMLHVLDLGGQYIDRFALANDLHSMSFRNGKIVVSMLPPEVGRPTVVEYSIRGERLREFGRSEFAGKLRLLNKGYVATDQAGNVRQAQLFFPMIRVFGADGREVDEWHDFGWWPNQSLRERVTRGQNKADREALRLSPDGQDIIGRRTVFWDLEHAVEADEWVGLVYGPLIQMFDARGVPAQAFVPLDGLAAEERDGWPWDIGVSPSAHLVCVVFHKESLVRCYSVPGR